MLNSMRGSGSAACHGRSHGKTEKCAEWVEKYMGDCLCSNKDILSFGVGLVSVFCWGVAEVPQIITNFREGSTEGISLLFLMTWVIGDILNLLGCYLEPSTLPTQFYVAVLYTITTLILLGQVIYYEHFLRWRRVRTATKLEPPGTKLQEEQDKSTESIEANERTSQAASQPIVYGPSPPLSAQGQLYFTSARSLASSRTPTSGSYLAVGSGRGSAGRSLNYSILQQNSGEDFQESRQIPIRTNASRSSPSPLYNTRPSPPSILRSVTSVVMCVGGLNIGKKFMTRHQWHTPLGTSSTAHVFSGRKLLQLQQHYFNKNVLNQDNHQGIGVWLGWGMAAIYMGGRLPQIWLNIKRGSVEGLNPLMFSFALLGNVTYIASILIRTAKWETIKLNMPWLVDAGVCVCLDCFILCQFIYYYTRESKEAKEDSGEDFKRLE